jgi:hypothetical protein
MDQKDIKRIIRKQIKQKHANWIKLKKKEKKQLAKAITDAVVCGYQGFDEDLGIPIEELIGIENQIIDQRIIPLNKMGDLVDNFHLRSGLIDFVKFNKPSPEIINKEIRFIDNLFNDRIINHLLANEGYTPQKREILPCQLFRAEILKAIKYPEISYRKYCTGEYMGKERKENRRFLGLPLNTDTLIDHTQLSHFRSSLKYHQIVNILIYVLHHFYRSGLMDDCVIHGVDSTEIANDNSFPLYTIEVGDQKVRIYNDIDCDCGVRRNKRDKSKFVIGYRVHTLTAINPSNGHAFPLVSLLGPANHHDSLYLKPLVRLAQAMGIEMKLITADEAYNDNDGSILSETGVHLITPASSKTKLPVDVEPKTLSVTCHDLCDIPMVRLGLGVTTEGHEYKCNALPGECSRGCRCQKYRVIPFDNGHFQRMPIASQLSEQALDIRKNCERPFNLLKKREGLENARVRSQEALTGRVAFAMIATLLIEMAGTRKKKPKNTGHQLQLFEIAA